MSNEYTPTPELKPKTPRKLKLINAVSCRKAALETAAAIRPANKFTRVSGAFLEDLNTVVIMRIREKVKSHPSVGKTLV